MIKQTYQLELLSPAFLGDAEQKGVWRTPPLKALIREWWRVAVAQELNYDHAAIKTHEKALFGNAADDNAQGNQKSRIRFALKHWKEGGLTTWPDRESRVNHPEVKNRAGKPMPVGSELYLGYGPLIFERGGTQLKSGAALQEGESNELRLAFPDEHRNALERAVELANWFGTIGGRSRNGWGSLQLGVQDKVSRFPDLGVASLQQSRCVRALRECLMLNWPHAIGSDSKGVLVWQSSAIFKNWRDAMAFLARTKIAFRTELGFSTGDRSPIVEPRHVLAYPVTKHSVREWGGNTRIANSLRFKLHKKDGGVQALIYHTPCEPTLAHAGIDWLVDTWQRVHSILDANAQLTRLA